MTMLIINVLNEHIKVQDLPYFSKKSCLFLRGETWLYKSYARDQAGGEMIGWVLYSSPGSFFFI